LGYIVFARGGQAPAHSWDFGRISVFFFKLMGGFLSAMAAAAQELDGIRIKANQASENQ
jgi:hypothetical protein